MRYLAIAGFLLMMLHGLAQTKPSSPALAYPDYKWAVNWSPLALAQLDYTFLGGVEYRRSPKLSLTADAGYIFGSLMYRDLTGGHQGQGFIFRPGVRLYTSAKGRYIQGQLFYKQVTHRIYDWLEKDVVNNVSSYEQLQDFRYRRTAVGFNVVVGRNTQLGDNIFLDFYFGGGLRYKTWSVVGEPNSRYRNTGAVVIGDDDEDGNSPSILPSIPAGIRLVFIL